MELNFDSDPGLPADTAMGRRARVAHRIGEAHRVWYTEVVPDEHFATFWYDDYGYPLEGAPLEIIDDFNDVRNQYPSEFVNDCFVCPGCRYLATRDHVDEESSGSGPGFAGGMIYFTRYRCGFTDLDESADLRAAE
jgi:hypothetical protein